MPSHTFRSNTRELKQWLGKRQASLEQERLPMESLWRDVRLHFEPFLGKGLIDGDPDSRVSEREDESIYNTEPRILLHRMGAGLQSGITNQARQWFKLATVDKKLAEYPTVRKWLDQSTEIVQSAMNRSNVYPALDQLYMHLGCFGTSAGLVVPDDENVAHVHIVDEGNYWIAENRRGRVETLLRRRSMTVGTLIEEFGEGWLPDQVMERAKQGRLEERYTVMNLVCRHDPARFKDVQRERLFVSVYWLDGQNNDTNAGILAIRSFSYNPILAPRWAVHGSAYGVGCGILGLADAKQLQALELDKLKLVEAEVDPAMAAPASMKGLPIDTGPGGITYYDPIAMGGRAGGIPVGRLFETRQQIQAVLLAIEATEKRLGRTFYSDLFSMMLNLDMQAKPMTAREVNERSAEKVAQIGPILTRLNNDLLDPLVDAIFALCAEADEFPVRDAILEEQPLRIEYVSSLHVEQQSATRMSGLFKLAEFVGGLAQFKPDIVDKCDFDEMVDVASVAMTEHGVVRDDKSVREIRKARADQEAQIRQAEVTAKSVPAVSRAAKDLSQTPLGTGSALDAVAAAAGGRR